MATCCKPECSNGYHIPCAPIAGAIINFEDQRLNCAIHKDYVPEPPVQIVEPPKAETPKGLVGLIPRDVANRPGVRRIVEFIPEAKPIPEPEMTESSDDQYNADTILLDGIAFDVPSTQPKIE